MKGFKAASHFHEENSGLPYLAFKIEEGKKAPDDAKIVRVLASTDEDNDLDLPVIASIVMHQKFKVLNSTPCLAQDSLKPEPDICPLCRVKAPRTLRTFIPVRVRGSKKDEVHIIEYGRNNIQEVSSLLDELENGDITSVDFKIKRLGKGKDTKYKWMIVNNTTRPLSDEEKALEIPDMTELIPMRTVEELEVKAREWARSNGVVKTEGLNDNEPASDDDMDGELPF